jgi:Fe-S-cluster-containing hydrogenase component 2
MHNRDKSSEKPKRSWSLLGLLHREHGTTEPSPHQTKDRIAVKCDLCAGYPYYACVHACPVGAAFRIDPVKTFGRTDLMVGLEMKH